MDGTALLVVSAHAADFVWRAGGTIASYTASGSRVHVVCLTFGERGESNSLWASGAATDEATVKTVREREACAAATILGADITFLDYGDHPLLVSRDRILDLARLMREVRPAAVLTHGATDVLNPDHESAFELTRWALRAATVKGVAPQPPHLPYVPRLITFESDQSTLDQFRPNTYIDVTRSMDRKVEAMRAVRSQYDAMGERYVARAALRASQLINHKADFAEAFHLHHPYEGQRFPLGDALDGSVPMSSDVWSTISPNARDDTFR